MYRVTFRCGLTLTRVVVHSFVPIFDSFIIERVHVHLCYTLWEPREFCTPAPPLVSCRVIRTSRHVCPDVCIKADPGAVCLRCAAVGGRWVGGRGARSVPRSARGVAIPCRAVRRSSALPGGVRPTPRPSAPVIVSNRYHRLATALSRLAVQSENSRKEAGGDSTSA